MIEPHALVSEDFGKSWRDLRANLPTGAGSTKVIREDLYKGKPPLLGTEFGAFVSIEPREELDPSSTTTCPPWGRLEFALHPTTGEIVAATHGRACGSPTSPRSAR